MHGATMKFVNRRVTEKLKKKFNCFLIQYCVNLWIKLYWPHTVSCDRIRKLCIL